VIARRCLRALAAAAATLGALHAGAQSPAKATVLPVAGQSASGMLTFVEREHHLDVELALTDLPPSRPFALHLADDQRCPKIPGTPPSPHAVVPDVAGLRADAHGRLYLRFVLDGLTLSSIANSPVAVYAAPDDGGAMLGCGPLSVKGFVTMPPPPPPAASLADARACMDSEDRVVALDRRGDADKAAVDAARTAESRVALRDAQAVHDAEFQAFLKAHAQRCGTLRISAQDRATVLQERAAAASAAR